MDDENRALNQQILRLKTSHQADAEAWKQELDKQTQSQKSLEFKLRSAEEAGEAMNRKSMEIGEEARKADHHS